MEPLLDEDSNGCSDERDEETQNPECVDDNIDCGLLEGQSSEVRDS